MTSYDVRIGDVSSDVCSSDLRDLQQHGSWLARARDGRWVAITNVRRMEIPDPAAPSRGGLVSGYLRSTLGARAYGESLPPSASRYAGFNLLLGDRDGVWYLSNKPQFAMQIGRASCRERVCQYV